MSFLVLNEQNVASKDTAQGFVVYVSPRPPDGTLPTVWLDLHVADEYYQTTGDTAHQRLFRTCPKTGRKYVSVGPGRGIRLNTSESIGCDTKHSGVVVNVASRAKHGLIVAPGKVDPGFNPKRLVLVIFNQSSSRVRIWCGDKIASIAFLAVDGDAPSTQSPGHADSVLGDFDPRRWQQVARWFAARDYGAVAYDVGKLVLSAGLALLAAWLLGYLGLKRP